MAAVMILLLTLIGAINILHLVTVTRRQDAMLRIISELDGNPADRFRRDASQAEGAFPGRRLLPLPKDPGQGDLPDAEAGRILPPGRGGRQDAGMPGFFEQSFSVDDALSTRFFSAWLDGEGGIIRVDTSQIFAVTEDGAMQMAQEILNRKKTGGRLKGFRFLLSGRAENSAAQEPAGEGAALPEAGQEDSGRAENSAAADAGAAGLLVVMDVSGDDDELLSVLGISVLIAALCWAAMLLPVRFLARRAIAPTAMSIERQKQFVTNAGHELKTPLAIIQANTEALELFNGESKWTRNIRAQTVRLSALMQNLLTLSRMDEESIRLEKKPIDLAALACEVWEHFAQSAAAKGLEAVLPEHSGRALPRSAAPCHFGSEAELPGHSGRGTEADRPAAAPRALGDRETLAQLLSILFDNAVKYTPEGGRIRVNVAGDEKEVVLVQSNTLAVSPEGGDGIPEDAERLFERFYRADADRSRKKGGCGIGLSAARAIASANGGTITAGREEGELCFTVRLKKA